MSEPTPMPDAIDLADAEFRKNRTLDELMDDVEPFTEADIDAYTISDLSDEEWENFWKALHS